MKYLITIIIALLISGANYAQSLYSMNYTMSLGTGETGKYISNTSFRGVTFEGRGFISDNLSLGGLWNWTTMYESLNGASYTDDTKTLTGNQYRYLNAFPFLFQTHYYLSADAYSPRVYMGGGLGAYKMIQRTNVGTWSIENNKWHFGISPEIGVLFPFNMTTSFNVNLRWHYVFKAKDTIDYSWFGLSVGFAWGD